MIAADVERATTQADLLEVFQARCQARALLYLGGAISLHDAVDELQRAAEATGLVEQIGQDEVQAIMSDAFAVVRQDELVAPNE